MEVIASFIIVLAFLATVSPLRHVPDSELVMYQNPKGIINIPIRYDVKPLSVYKDQNITKQQFDYSCGSAALATLLNYYLAETLTEQQVIQGLMEYGDAKSIEQRRAFSLLDMKQFVTVLGYQGAGFTAEMEDLKALDKPCIVPIEFYGYKHFVVYRGIYGDHVFFADPYMGNISFTVKEFKEMWYKNIVFLVTNPGGATMNALRLKEEDLRVVSFDMLRENRFRIEARSSIVDSEHMFRETYGDLVRYKKINVP